MKMTVQRVGHCLSLYLGLPHYGLRVFLVRCNLSASTPNQPRKGRSPPISPPPHPSLNLSPIRSAVSKEHQAFSASFTAHCAATLYMSLDQLGTANQDLLLFFGAIIAELRTAKTKPIPQLPNMEIPRLRSPSAPSHDPI